MISKEILPLQEDYIELGECSLTLGAWAAQGLVVRLLELAHGQQWLYCNVHVHDSVTAGIAATTRKEEIQQFIEDQLDLGKSGWTNVIKLIYW